MYFRILKNDLKRKRSMNILLFILIAVATMFITGSVNNLKVIMQGTNYFFEKSELTDYIILSEDNEKITQDMKDFLESCESIDELFIDDLCSISNSDISINDGIEEFEILQSAFVNSYNIKQQKFFDKNDDIIDNVEDGEIWINYKLMKEKELVEGDIINITTAEGITKHYKIAGYMKDAFIGPEVMGTVRFLLSENDFNELYKFDSLVKYKMYSMNLNDEEQFNKEYNNVGYSGIFNDSIESIRMMYFMDMLTASIFIIVSICLITMAILILRFTIIFIVTEDIKQIGILKAIGIKDFNIRYIYLLKYLFISMAGAIVGIIFSNPFGKILLDKALKNIVTDSSSMNITISILCGLMVVIVIGIFGYLATARLKKLSPLSAIKNGNSGERFNKKSGLKLSKSKLTVSSYLAINDILCNKKRFIVLGITFIIGVWLVTIPAITADTLKGEEVVNFFGTCESDLFLVDQSKFTEIMNSADRNKVIELLDETTKQIDDLGYNVKDAHIEMYWKFKIAKEDRSFISISYQGTGVDASEYSYFQGKAPMLENEVAITKLVANKINANIGDKVKITTNGDQKEYIITALFQSMSNLGEGIRFSEQAQISYQSPIGIMGVQINFKEDYTDVQLEEIQSEISDKYPTWVVQDTTEFLSGMMGGVIDQITAIKIFILCLVAFINALIILLMQKMFLIRDTGQIAFLKSLGIRNSTIIAWITKRIMFVNCIGSIIAVALCVPLTQISSGQVFKIMGANKMQFKVNIVDTFFVYPAILIVCGIIVTLIASLKAIRIKVKDSCEME